MAHLTGIRETLQVVINWFYPLSNVSSCGSAVGTPVTKLKFISLLVSIRVSSFKFILPFLDEKPLSLCTYSVKTRR